MQRKIVTLCGSTRFYVHFQEANYRETMTGNIVLSVGFFRPSPQADAEHVRHEGSHGESWGCTPAQKAALDVLHLDKIKMSDEIFVLNVDGYVGESTRSEVAFAIARAKGIRWLEPAKGEAWMLGNTHDLGRRAAEHLVSKFKES